MDAGNSCKKAARLLDAQNTEYLMAIKESQGRLHEEAVERLAEKPEYEASFRNTEDVNGRRVPTRCGPPRYKRGSKDGPGLGSWFASNE